MTQEILNLCIKNFRDKYKAEVYMEQTFSDYVLTTKLFSNPERPLSYGYVYISNGSWDNISELARVSAIEAFENYDLTLVPIKKQ